jgi:3-hydroxyisobutyrate dehydrogenase-like beta-hydroxyacid dehydrogenase
MQVLTLGVVHPGEMGVSMAVSAKNSGVRVLWASRGRSAATAERASKAGLEDVQRMEDLCQSCQIVISVCPPHAAESVSEDVLRHGFSGVFVDANAISPQRTRRIAARVEKAGARFVDGGIIGPPAWQANTTWLYLAGPAAGAVASCFCAGPLQTIVMAGEVGEASAIKMCYAAWTKGSTALLGAVLATAEQLGVRQVLQEQWTREGRKLVEQAKREIPKAARKAWRYAPEMEEISATFAAAGLPGDFHAAAAELYRRLAHCKDSPEAQALEAVLAALPDNAQHASKQLPGPGETNGPRSGRMV